MAPRQHMHAQLMASPCSRHQPDPRFTLAVPRHPPGCQRRLAGRVTDHLSRTVRPVDDQRQINLALFRFQPPGDPRHVNLFRTARRELPRKGPLRMGAEREHHYPRRVPVQPVHQQGLRKGRPHPRQQTIGQMRPAPRNRQQTLGLYDRDQRVILVQNLRRSTRRVIIAHPLHPSPSLKYSRRRHPASRCGPWAEEYAPHVKGTRPRRRTQDDDETSGVRASAHDLTTFSGRSARLSGHRPCRPPRTPRHRHGPIGEYSGPFAGSRRN